MEHPRYDLCVLGAGPAGYAAAIRAHDLGKRVLLVEKARVGGAGIHHGALSSKTMWHLSNDFATLMRRDRGYHVRDVELCYPEVMAAVRNAVAERKGTLVHQLEKLAVPAANGGWVRLVRGKGRFVSPQAVEVAHADGALERFEADNFLIATGSIPRTLPGIDVDGHHILTSDHIEGLPDFPKSMVVVGGGVIGCEYATIFGNYRRTKISIIDRQPRILPFEDEDVAAVIASNFEQMGILLHREARLQSMRVVDGQVEYILCDPSGVCQPIRVERALVSIGRVPNVADLDLENAGVTLTKTGGIDVDRTQSVTAPHIYAAGDTTMDIALANVAELEGRHAVERMFGLNPAPLRYEALSAIMFLSPEVASVGLNEQLARQKGIPYRVGVVRHQLVNRSIAMRETVGFIKLLASTDSPGRILGLRVVGPEASSTIQGIAFLIEEGGTLEDIDHCVHPHPAITEGVQECARLLLGRSIHKTEVFSPALIRRGEG